MTVYEQQSVVNLPDLLFVKYCEETYGLNRGVYNVIDEWFYRQDLYSIKIRRQQILEFLLFFISSISKVQNGHKLKFGRGELTSILTEYWERQRVLI